MICDHTLHGCRTPRFKDLDSYSYIKFLLPINFVSSSNSPKYLLLMQQLTRILEFLFIYFLGGAGGGGGTRIPGICISFSKELQNPYLFTWWQPCLAGDVFSLTCSTFFLFLS